MKNNEGLLVRLTQRTARWSEGFALFFQGCCLTMIVVATCAATSAQTNRTVAGQVTDERSGNIAGAQVIVTSRAGVQRSSTTDDKGAFRFVDVPPDEYLIEVKAEGFSRFADQVVVEPEKNIDLRLELKVAGINENVVVTAEGTPQHADEVSKVVSVLDSQELELKHELTLPEALRGTPGIRVQQQGSPGTLTSIRLRGQRTFDTSLLIDGLRVRDAGDINGSAASLLTDLVPVATDRVEVLRGAGSTLHGSSAIGGAVNLVPETYVNGLHFVLGAEAGGLSTFRERFKVSGGNARAGFTFGLNRLDIRKGVDGQDQFGNTIGNGRFQFNVTPSLSIAGNVFGTFSNARLNDSPFALPSSFTLQPFPDAQAGVNYQPDFNNPDQGRRHRLLVGSVRLSHEINETFSYSIAYQRVSSKRRNYNGPEIDPQFAAFYPFGESEFISLNNGTTDTVDGRVNLRLGRSNLITAGLEFENETAQQQFLSLFFSTDNPVDRQRTFAVFGQDQLSLFDDRLRLSIGIRAQFFRLRAADRPGFLTAINPDNSITGDGSVAYLLRSTRTKIRAHVGNGFRAPSLFERFGSGTFPGVGFTRFGDPTLKAEQSISVDGGFDQRLADDRLVFGATYFYTRLQRVIVSTGFSTDPLGLGRVSGFANQPGGLSRGLESYLETNPARETSIRASYTLTNSDRMVPFRGLQPEYVIPRHVLGLSLNQRYRSFAFSFDVNRTGSYIAPVFENNFPFRTAELTFSGYTKADLFGSFEKRAGESVTVILFAGADNIFNQRYYENGFLAPGIVGRTGIRLKF